MGNIRKFSSHLEIEEQASNWLARLDGDQDLSNKDLAELKEWINRSPVHRAELNRLAMFWDNANIMTELSIPLYYNKQHVNEKQGLFARFWDQPRQAFGAVAALFIISILLGLGIWIIDNENSNRSGFAGNGGYQTRIGEQNTIKLADGSVIEMNTNSQVQVNYTRNQRSIQLIQGEAHFKVSKDRDRPFVVETGEGRVTAIGTAFVVRVDRKTLKVTVTEGKVGLAVPRDSILASVMETDRGPLKSTISDDMIGVGSLEAGETIFFDPETTFNMEEAVEKIEGPLLEKQLAWREGLLLFTGDPLSEVIQEINRYTTVKIEIIDPAIAGLRIGGQFKVGETEAMLNVLAANFDVEVRHVDTDTIHLAMKSRGL